MQVLSGLLTIFLIVFSASLPIVAFMWFMRRYGGVEMLDTFGRLRDGFGDYNWRRQNEPQEKTED